MGFILFALGLLAQLILSSSGGFLSYIMYDPCLMPAWLEAVLRAFPPLSFFKVFADINSVTASQVVQVARRHCCSCHTSTLVQHRAAKVGVIVLHTANTAS